MLLENKVAVIYGGGGAIGGAVSWSFAREGARVFLAGRTRGTLDRVVERIRAAGERRTPPRWTRSTRPRSTSISRRLSRLAAASTSAST